MTQFVHTMEGYAVNVARVRFARREKTPEGMYVWRIETDWGGTFRVPDNGATPFACVKPPPDST